MLDLLGSEELTVNGRQRQLDGDLAAQQGVGNGNIFFLFSRIVGPRYGDGGSR